MPSDYAHYRFGNLALPTLPQELQRSVARFRRLYDVGQHGPDPFFHYSLLRHTTVGELASSMHMDTGEQCFTRACKRLRRHPSEAAAVYLYGFLGHFCLDSICHPFIHQHTDEGPIGHTELEIEFDRFLLEMDGKSPAYRQDFSGHMRLSRNEAATAAQVLDSITPAQIYHSTHNMARNTHLLHTVNPKLLKAVLKGQKKEIRDQQMPLQENTNCSHLDGELLTLYNQALEIYPDMVRQLTEHIRSRSPLGPEFQKIFG